MKSGLSGRFSKNELIPLCRQPFGETCASIVAILYGLAAAIGYLVSAEAKHRHAAKLHVAPVEVAALAIQVNHHVHE